jgi:hypothetical protein
LNTKGLNVKSAKEFGLWVVLRKAEGLICKMARISGILEIFSNWKYGGNGLRVMDRRD